MLEQEGNPRHGQSGETCVRPLDESDRVVEVRLEVTPLRSADPDEAVEIEVGDSCCSPVEMPNRKRGARDGLVDAERPAGSPDEGRLACTELAADEDDVAGSEESGELRAERFCLGRRQRGALDHELSPVPGSKEAELRGTDRHGVVLRVIRELRVLGRPTVLRLCHGQLMGGRWHGDRPAKEARKP